MQRKKLFFLIILIALSACGQVQTNTHANKDSIVRDTIAEKKEALKDKKPMIDTIVNNAFIDRITGDDLVIEKVNKIYADADKKSKVEPNEYDKSKSDTTVTLSKSGDTFTFLKTTGKVLALSCTITTTEMILIRILQWGYLKAFLQKSLI